MTDHSSISRVHAAPLVICSASCQSAQLLPPPPRPPNLSFFSFCPTFSVLFMLLTRLLKHSCHRLNEKKKRRQLVCRRTTLVTCHVFFFFFLEGGVVIMCCVVHSGSEGQINKEPGSPLQRSPHRGTMTGTIHHFCL